MVWETEEDHIIDLDGNDDGDDDEGDMNEQLWAEVFGRDGEPGESEGDGPGEPMDAEGPGEPRGDGPGEPNGVEGPMPDIPAAIGGARRPRRYAVRNRRRHLTVPRVPTQAEKDEHMLTHQPPEDWCEFCARGKTLAKGHQDIREDERICSCATVSLDL